MENRLKSFLIGMVFFVFSFLLTSQPRGWFYIYVSLVFFLTVSYASNLIYFHWKFILLLLFVIVSSIYSNYFLGCEFSIFQVFRSQGWFLISIFIGLNSGNLFIDIDELYFPRVVKFLADIILLYAITVLLYFVFDIFYIPTEIAVLNGEVKRIYIVGFGVLFPLSIIFFYSKRYLSFLLCFLLIYISGGKTGFVLTIMSFIYIGASLKINLLKSFVLTLILIVFSLFYWNLISDRSKSFLQEGDLKRLSQIDEAYDKFNTDIITNLIGIGFGTQYGNGYGDYVYNPDSEIDQESLYVNSKYDIENGYLFLLLRFGFVGIFLMFNLLFKMGGRYNKIFLFYCAVIFLSGSPVGPAFCLTVLSFIFLNRFQYVLETKSS